MGKARAVTAGQIASLLISRHCEKFVCVTECKTGPTYVSSGCPRIDLWCMAKSWAHPRVIAYEIKVSRGDFLNDNKWRDYLPFCTEFYFAAPMGIIQPDELPPEAGLAVASKNVKRIYTKKKAPTRGVEIPDSIFRYILMARAQITEDRCESPRDFWRRWLERKDEDKRLGAVVTRKIQELVKTRIDDVSRENTRLVNQNKALEKVKAFTDRLGIDIHAWGMERDVKAAIAGCRTEVMREIEHAYGAITKLHALVQVGPGGEDRDE